MSLRIAMIGAYPPPYGGVSTTLLQLSAHLIRDHYEVRVFDPNPNNVGAPSYVYCARLRTPRLSKNLLINMIKYQPNVIHSHASTIATAGVVVAKMLNVPLIHHVYGERFPEQFAAMSPLQRLRLRWAISQADYLIPVSEGLAGFLSTIEPCSDHIKVVPCLLPFELSVEEMQKAATPVSKTLIVTTGFYPFANPHYGFEIIPIVARYLCDHDIDFTWYLVGQGTDIEIKNFTNILQEFKVQNRIQFLGELDRPEILRLLSKAHIYVRTKYSDSFGIVIAEAHQLGCHCLFGDNNPYFQEGPRLSKYQTGDANSLAEKLLGIVPQVALNKSQHMDSPFADEAQQNYEIIRQIYREVTTND